MTNIEPKFEPLALSSIDWPVIACVILTPGRRCAIVSIWSITAVGPLLRGRVGQLHVDQQVAHVLRRDEPRRASS